MGDLSVDLIARDRERAREKGAGARAGRGIARMRVALQEFSVAMSLERFGFSSSASSVTASTSLPAGEVVSRANVFCARPQCAHAKYVRPAKLLTQRFNSARKEGCETSCLITTLAEVLFTYTYHQIRGAVNAD